MEEELIEVEREIATTMTKIAVAQERKDYEMVKSYNALLVALINQKIQIRCM